MQDDFLAAIEAGDEQRCVGLLKGLTETARRALHPAVRRVIEAIDSTIGSDFGASRSQNFRRYRAARLAMLGTATLGELTRSIPWHLPADAAYAILTERRPDWLGDWAQLEMERNVSNWAVVRAMVRNGLVPRPTSDAYILGMIIAPNRSHPPRQLLDRGLLEEELWRLFECEGSGELSLAAYDKYVQKQNTWLEGFRAMVADGIIDRRRVLTATLDALARDFAPFRAGWFSRLHEALKPTRAERVAYRERYLHLLSSRVPATVSFAMKALVEVDKAGALDAVGALNQLGAALDARDKGTAERALRILTKAAHNAGSASVKARIAAIAAQALGHQSVDVQALALSLIEANAAVENFDLSALAPSVRGGLKAKVVEHEAAMSSLPPGREVQGVVPVGNLGELAELFAAVLEHQGPPVDIERVVEGVARMSASERLTASLARRAGKMLDSRERQQLAAPSPSWHSHGLAGDRSRSLPPTTTSRTFLSGACGVLPSKTVQRQERPLMSLPTWPDGRIDPVEFARRAAAQPRHELDATHADPASLFNLDLLQARLRAGIDRERALPQLHLTWKTKTSQASGNSYSHHYAVLELRGSSEQSRFDPALLSTVSFGASLEMKRWCATVCAGWREGWFAAGCRDLAYNLDWRQADWSTRAYLESLLQPQTEIGPMAGLLLALGLGAKERGQSMLAVDALIASVGEGRLFAAALGRALVEVASSGAIKFARWSKQLSHAAQAGPLQAKAIFVAVETLFESGQGIEAADYFRLVELERELAHQAGLRLSRPGAISILRRIPTGGKTKRAIAELLSL